MKKITLLIFMALLSFCGYAQLDEDFEGNGTNLPPGWNRVNVAGPARQWVIQPHVANIPSFEGVAGTHAAYIDREIVASGTLTEDWLVTPVFEVPENGQLRFQSRLTVPLDQGTIYELYINTTNSSANPADFDLLEEWGEFDINPSQTEYNQIVVNLPSEAYGDNVRLAFVMKGNNGDRWLIDMVQVIEQCLAPTGLDATNVGLDTATLTWTNNSSATSFEIEIVDQLLPPTGSGFIYNGLPPYNATAADGLSEDSAFKFYVRAICDNEGVGNYSAWAGPFNFSTVALGATCEAPITITSLPYTTTDNTAGYGDDYSGSPGSSGCGTTSAYLNGDDVVYAYEALEDGVISIEMTNNGPWSGIFVYDDCADIGVNCLAGGIGGSAGNDVSIDLFPVTGGTTYYFLISTFATPQTTPYTLTIQVVNCPPPTGLGVSDVNENSANLSWDANGATSWEVVVQTQGSGLPIDTAGVTTTVNTDYNVTATTAGVAFTEATGYEYYVRADCGDGTFSTWSGPFVFTTTQVPATMNYSENFDGGASGFTLSNGTQTNKWVIGSATSNSPANSLYISNNEGVSNTYTNTSTSVVHAYRDIQMPASVDQVNLSFDWKAQGESCCDYLRVWIVPAATFTPTPGTQITVANSGGQQIGGNRNMNNTWTTVNQTINATAYSGQVLRVIFEWRNDGSVGTNPPAAVDNIALSVITCPEPSNLAITDLEQDQVSIDWNGPTSVSPTFDYYLATTNTPPTDGTTPTGNVADSDVTIPSLTPSTTYWFWVRSNCGPDDTSFWVGPISFTTPQIPAVMDYSEDFDGTGNTGWTLGNGTQTNKWVIGSATSSSPSNSLYITNDNGVSNAYSITSTSVVHAYRDILITEDAQEILLSYEWKAVGESCCDYLRVWMVPVTFTPTPGTLITAANSGGTQYGGNHNMNANWTAANHVINASGFEGTVRRLIFEWRNDGSVGTQPPAAVDNINLSLITCPAPSNLAMTDLQQNEASFEWDAPASLSPTYDYYVGTTNEVPNDDTVPTGNTPDTEVTVSPLEPATNYWFWVRSNCGPDDTSFWIGPINFITQQVPAELDYSEDFDGGGNTGWTLSNGTQTNKWVIGTATSNSPDTSLYVSNDNGVSNAYTHTLSVVHAYRDIFIPAGTEELQFSYDWKAQGESCCDYLRVWMAPVTFTPTPGTLITVANSGGTQYGGNHNMNSTWSTESYIVNSSGFAGTVRRVIFEWRNDGSGGSNPPAAVDNVNLAVFTCPRPTDLFSENIDYTSVMLNWTPGGSETQWEVVIQEQNGPAPGANPANSIIVDDVAQYLNNNVVDGVFYEFYVRAICGPDDVSLWSGPSFFSVFVPPGCAGVEVFDPSDDLEVIAPGSEFVICPGEEECIDLTANYFMTGETTEYLVESIAYEPPFPFIGGTELNVTTDDIWSPVVNLPFEFCFFGDIYSEAKVGSNGVVQFGNNMTDGGNCPWAFNQQIPNTGFPIRNAIYGVYQDIFPNASGDVSINYQVLGTYPCRALVVNYYQVPQFSCGTSVGLQTSQIVIYEISNVIEVYVENRTPCTQWQQGVGVIGIQNAAGTEAAVPPGRNTGAWTATQEAWRFVPDGEPNVVFEWLKDGEFYSSDLDINVCIDDVTNMTARATYTNCNGEEIVRESEFTIRVADEIILQEPQDLSECSTAEEATFDLNDAIQNMVPDLTLYDISFYDSEEAATEGNPDDALPELYTATESQTIWVRVSDGPCFALQSFELLFNGAPPQFTLTEDLTICEGSEAELTVTPGNFDINDVEITWTLDGEPIAQSGSPITITEGGVYEVTVNNNGCTDTASVTVTTEPAPVVDQLDDVTVCDQYELPVLTQGDYYTQPGGEGIMLSAGELITTTQTIYIYAEAFPGSECIGESSFEVTVAQTPVITVSDVEACESYTLPALAQGNYYTGPGGTGDMMAAGDVITTDQTLYIYAETGTTPNCSAEAEFTITIVEGITADAPADVAECDSYTLEALNPGNNYYTGPGGTGDMLMAGDVIIDTQVIYVYAQSGDCSDENSFTVVIIPSPEVTISGDCEGNDYILNVTFDDQLYNPDNVTFTWTNATGTPVGTDSPRLAITESGTYTVTVTPAGDADCPITASITVDETSCMIPRGISPNGDGMNDSFDLTGLNVSKLSIFNRYGQELFTYGNYTNQWYGQSKNGDELPTGTYFYMIERTNGETKTGWVYINREQ